MLRNQTKHLFAARALKAIGLFGAIFLLALTCYIYIMGSLPVYFGIFHYPFAAIILPIYIVGIVIKKVWAFYLAFFTFLFWAVFWLFTVVLLQHAIFFLDTELSSVSFWDFEKTFWQSTWLWGISVIFLFCGVEGSGTLLTKRGHKLFRKVRIKGKMLPLWEILIVVAINAFVMGIFLPALSKVRNYYRDDGAELMSRIYGQVVMGHSKQKILDSLGKKEKLLLQDYGISWLDTIPVKTEQGFINPYWLPKYHVVVYGITEGFITGDSPRLTSRNEVICSATGHIEYLRCLDPNTSRLIKAPPLDVVVRTTRFGTSQILQGTVSDISEIVDIEHYHLQSIQSYILLKKFIIREASYLQFAIDLVTGSDYWFDSFVGAFLKNSIASPTPPSVGPEETKQFREAWIQWHQEHAGQIELTDEFLFAERLLPQNRVWKKAVENSRRDGVGILKVDKKINSANEQ